MATWEDRLNNAADLAETASSRADAASQIFYDVANGGANATVPTASGDVDSIAKTIQDMRESLEGTMLAAKLEEFTLSENQTNITLQEIRLDHTRPLLFIEGVFETDYIIVSNTQIRLGQSYPEGTRGWILQNITTGLEELQDVTQDVMDAKSDAEVAASAASVSADEAESANAGAVLLNRSLQRHGDLGQTLHSDFKLRGYGLGTRETSGVSRAVKDDEMWKCERASPKWVMGPNGKLVEVPENELAYHYDPVTGEALGVLVEGEATNLFTDSQNPSSWDLPGGSASTTADESVVEGSNWINLQADSDGNKYLILDRVTPDGLLTTSAFIRKGFGQGKAFILMSGVIGLFDANAGTYSVSAGSPTSIGMEDMGGSFRIHVTEEYDGSSEVHSQIGLRDAVEGDFIHLAGVQLEEGAPSSYIPTDGAPETRAAENVYRNFGGEFNPNSFTIYTEALVISPDNFQGNYLTLTRGVYDGSITLSQSPTSLLRLKAYGHPDLPDTTVSTFSDEFNKVALVVDGEAVHLAVDGIVSLNIGTVDVSKVQDFTQLLLSNLRTVGDTYQVQYKEMADVRILPAMNENELIEVTS